MKGNEIEIEEDEPDDLSGQESAESGASERDDADFSWRRRIIVSPAERTLTDLRQNRVVQLGVERAVASSSASLEAGRRLVSARVPFPTDAAPDTHQALR